MPRSLRHHSTMCEQSAMHNVLRCSLVGLGLVLVSGCGGARHGRAPAPSANVPPPATKEPQLLTLRDAFLAHAKAAGVSLPFVPELREWTRPSLISWRAEQHAVAVPHWNALSPVQRELMLRMAGEAATSRRLFELLFRWFLVPHELSHALTDEHCPGLVNHAASERRANDIAVAFHKQSPEAAPRLAELATLLAGAQTRLPSLAHFADETELNQAFHLRYAELGRDLPLYAAFQVHFMLQSLTTIDAAKLPTLLQNLCYMSPPLP